MQWATVRNLVAAIAGGFVVCCGSASASPSACYVLGNLVENCGFEHGLTHWNGDFAGGFVTSWAAYSGNEGLLFDSESGLLPLYQTLTTTPGTEYTISFMVEGSPQNASKVTVSWGGGPPIADLIDIPNAWTNYTFTETANSNSTQLTFGLADSSSGGFLDDIIVTSDVVPEPSSLAIFVVVLFGLGLTRRQRIRRAACRTEATRISKITEIAASAIQSITRARPGATI
jgi:hypothetical protein